MNEPGYIFIYKLSHRHMHIPPFDRYVFEVGIEPQDDNKITN